MSMCAITVRLEERGPARMRMRQRDRHGDELELARDDPELVEAEEAAWQELLGSGRRLPAGSVEVLVAADEFGRLAGPDEIGRAIAQAAA
jgi:hypothetical protein